MGIPQHYGLLYSMGLGLVMEGLLSGCYHLCPNKMNFQFGAYHTCSSSHGHPAALRAPLLHGAGSGDGRSPVRLLPPLSQQDELPVRYVSHLLIIIIQASRSTTGSSTPWGWVW
ncbi:hypothetical protein PYW07_011288 [Mythimna separata]|uniref:Uncharacterized protein n=1 Tax=Mythimna separata TaxID=271217 RepID=A0AAD8DM06_MYTSE|nr:hypothetical protein PYW07_011288 [Mythimna separata]